MAGGVEEGEKEEGGVMADRCLMTREEAARYLRVSLRYFQANIRPVVTRVEVQGKVRSLVRYEQEALDQWVAEHRVGNSGGTRIPGRYGGPRKGNGSSAPLDAETATIEAQLRRQLPKSTRRTCGKDPTANNVVELATRRSSNG